MRDDDDFIELRRDEADGDRFEYRHAPPMSPLKAKLILWSTVIGGIAIGTLLFLSFLALFVYLFVPIIVIASIWALVKYMSSPK